MIEAGWVRAVIDRLAMRPGRSPAAVGRRGERLVARLLARRGYRLLARNPRVAGVEVDLLALDPDGRTVVIVEVKARRGGVLPPEANVDRAKRERLVRFAARLETRAPFANRPIRFDVVTVRWRDGRRRPDVVHFANAFEGHVA